MALRAARFLVDSGPIRARSIYLKVKPAPANFSEQRAVLRMLKQYGDIEVFKRFDEPSSFVSVAGSWDIAQHIIQRSPLQFDHVPIHSNTSSPPRPKAPENGIAAESNNTSTTPGAGAIKTFTITVFPAPNYKHKELITQSPLYGPWPKDDHPLLGDLFKTASLRLVVPRDSAYTGLSVWSGPEDTKAGLPNTPESFFALRETRREQIKAADNLRTLFRPKSNIKTND
ncbi:hypothetical protein B0H67DRAFT_642996 [Lasiosphaeris hirsuta]|uniref:Uncharacterized protein n=1 Tax=Lasiosphaeris hirsuta TaxID=260670 RepID=A0AA40APL1_9PEZI|nr:hypothetical protein B0H67DRAFT_642996 [Lasiosphaeris hirsuta]